MSTNTRTLEAGKEAILEGGHCLRVIDVITPDLTITLYDKEQRARETYKNKGKNFGLFVDKRFNSLGVTSATAQTVTIDVLDGGAFLL